MKKNSAFLIVILVIIKYSDANILSSSNFTNVLTDAEIAETVPRVAVSSKSNKDDEKGFLAQHTFKDGGGYDEFESYGDRDKGKYGYSTELGFGKRVSSGRDGMAPKVQDKHSYRKVSRLGNGNGNANANQNAALKDIDILNDATTIRKKVEEKPKSASYTAPRSRNNRRGNNKKPSYEVVESVEEAKPSKTKKAPKKTPKSQRLTSYGPVLFDEEFSGEKKEKSAPIKKKPKNAKKSSEKKEKKEKKSKKPKKTAKSPEKSARFTDLGVFDLSLENDGYGAFDEVSSAELDGVEYEGANENGADYDAENNQDYEEEGAANNDYEEGEAANAEDNGEAPAEAEYEEAAPNDDYEETDDAEANDYEEGEEEDSTGEHSNGSDDFREHYIYASEADKDATYQR